MRKEEKMKNYIVINGKKAELTEEQLKKLGIDPKRKNPFDRVECEEEYFRIANGQVLSSYELNSNANSAHLSILNYFNDKDFANQLALHEFLNRKLLKYAWDNEAEDGEWDVDGTHYYIYYETKSHEFDITETYVIKSNNIYFSKWEIAKQAIEAVVKPFMAKHPEFVW